MKADHRSTSTWTSLEPWLRDLRHAARRLARAPGFTLAVFCSLAVCLGPNAAIFSALHALVLKPLPFPEPSQLVTVLNVAEKSGGQRVLSSTPQYVDFQAHADLFTGFATIRHDTVTLDEDTAPSRVPRDLVAADFFRVLGVQPIVGRFFTAEEEVPGRERVLVLSQNFWESHYQADTGVIGRDVRVGDQTYTIIGVAPRSVERLSHRVGFFQPYAPPASKFDPQARYRGDLALYARLKPGVPLDAGLAQLATLERAFQTQVATPQLRTFVANAGFRLTLKPLLPGGTGGETAALWLLQGAALLVLLIGGVNVVNLFLARMNAQRTEFAIRLALGADRFALLRPALAESILLTTAAAATGLGSALIALRVFNRYLPILLPEAPPVALDATVVAMMLAAGGGIALLLGLLPLHLLQRTGLRIGESRTASPGGRARTMSGVLVVAQVAIAVILLVGTGLLLRSFAKIAAIDPGFDAAHVVQGRMTLPSRYARAEDKLSVQHRILDSLRTIPGVEHVAISLGTTLARDVRPVPFALRSSPATTGDSQPPIHINAVSPDFFATMGMRILSGRGFGDADDFAKTPVAVVDQSFAERHLPGRIVEGQEIYLSRGLPLAVDAWPRLVGVVSRAQLTGLDSQDKLPVVFVPLVGFPAGPFEVLARSRRPSSEILRDVRARLHEIDPALLLQSAGSLQDSLDEMLMARRGITLLLGLFSGLALLLAAVGLYGVLACEVVQRTREIGIRGALGASRAQIVGLILRQGMGTTGLGLAAGVLGALFLTRYLTSLLFEIVPADPVSYLAVLSLLTAISLLACWLPARRAARVDPIVALRAE